MEVLLMPHGRAADGWDRLGIHRVLLSSFFDVNRPAVHVWRT